MSCPLDRDGNSLANVSFAATVRGCKSVGKACQRNCCPKAQEPECYVCVYCWSLGDVTQATSLGFLPVN